jgi:hypothetical protein
MEPSMTTAVMESTMGGDGVILVPSHSLTRFFLRNVIDNIKEKKLRNLDKLPVICFHPFF